MEQKKYITEDGKVYIQKPIVLAQYKQLSELLKNVYIPADLSNEMSIALALGDSLAKAFAIVLTPEGMSPRDKDLVALEDDISYNINLDTSLEVIRDFFVCNAIHSLLTKLTEIIKEITEKIEETTKESTQTT